MPYPKEDLSRSTASSDHSYVDTLDYFEQLLEEKRRLEGLGQVNVSAGLLELEIERVRQSLAHCTTGNMTANCVDEGNGRVTLTEKIWVPTERFPEYNFAGRILGPRGMTVKRVEQETGCRIYVRGKGSMKHAKGEDGLEEELNVVITVEDDAAAARAKMATAKLAIEKLITPGERGMDDLKRKQLMELAIINGNYRPSRNNPPMQAPKRFELPAAAPGQHPALSYLPLTMQGANMQPPANMPMASLPPLSLGQMSQPVATSMPISISHMEGFRPQVANANGTLGSAPLLYSLVPATYVQ